MPLAQRQKAEAGIHPTAAFRVRPAGHSPFALAFPGRNCSSATANREMIAAIRSQVADGYSSADDGRAAMAFFDRIGWLTPLKQREAAQQGE
jgi:hypothetical protein